MYKRIAVLMVGCSMISIAGAPLAGQPGMKPSSGESSAEFTIRNLGIPVKGTMGGLEGHVYFDPVAPQKASFDVTVQTATIETGIRARDEHLKRKDYLDVDAYPRIRFKSESVSAGKGQGQYLVRGLLTIKATTRPCSFPFTVEKRPDGYLFRGQFNIKRTDFGVGGSSISLSENLTISLRVITR